MSADIGQSAKRRVLDYYSAFEAATPDTLASVLERHTATDYRFRGVHPYNEISGVDATVETVWRPLSRAFRALHRRHDLFMAAPNRLDDTLWVTSMGKLLGLFDERWLTIPPTARVVQIPYCEFHRVEDDRIAESALWLDIISVMKQAGLRPLPEQTGAEIISPGPRTGDGLMVDAQDSGESQRTLDLIMRMCDDLAGDGMESPEHVLRETWHENMTWFGPSGIGATYTLGRYQQQHQGPFNAGLEDIEFVGHVLEHAEGHYGAWFGWPNLRMRQGKGFLGLPASERTSEMRVVDVYRREGDKLAENWIFIDLLHYLNGLGLDLLQRVADTGAPNR